MLLKYLFWLCLYSSSLFATSFSLDFACTIKNGIHSVAIRNIQFDIHANEPYTLPLPLWNSSRNVYENIIFKFKILYYDEQQVTTQITITRESTESSEITFIAQPSMSMFFNQKASFKISDFELTLMTSKIESHRLKRRRQHL